MLLIIGCSTFWQPIGKTLICIGKFYIKTKSLGKEEAKAVGLEREELMGILKLNQVVNMKFMFFFGPKFQPFLSQSPEIEIGVANSGGMSVGSAVERALNIPFSILSVLVLQL
jgi:hypothetical protein